MTCGLLDAHSLPGTDPAMLPREPRSRLAAGTQGGKQPGAGAVIPGSQDNQPRRDLLWNGTVLLVHVALQRSVLQEASKRIRE